MSGFFRGDFIRGAVALAAGLMLSACGGAPVEEAAPQEGAEESHSAAYIPRCDGSQRWRIDYFDAAGNPIGRMECTCAPSIYKSGQTTGYASSQLYYEGACTQW